MNLGWIDRLGVKEMKAELGKATVRYRAYAEEIDALRLQVANLRGFGYLPVGCDEEGRSRPPSKVRQTLWQLGNVWRALRGRLP